MDETMRNWKQSELLKDDEIREGLELLRLSQVVYEPTIPLGNYPRSFERCSRLKKEFVTMKAHSGV